MSKEQETREALEALSRAILEYNAEAARKAAQTIVNKGIDPMLAIREAIGGSTDILHQRFGEGEIFLPHLVMAGDAMETASEVLEPAIPKESMQAKKVVVIGTVEADIHSVGKNIVAMMLRSGGFQVHDLGVDVKATTFIDKARETNADIIALSCLLTTTRPYQREVIEELQAQGLRDKFKVIVGGGPITQEWAEQIGADGYGAEAMEGLELAKRLVGIEP